MNFLEFKNYKVEWKKQKLSKRERVRNMCLI